MSFIGRLFKRKKGGTRVGNLLRAFAHRNTYGLAGNDANGMSYGDMIGGSPEYQAWRETNGINPESD